MGIHFSYHLWVVCDSRLVVTLLEFNEKEEDVVALHLTIVPLKTKSGFEQVLRCEPSTYQPISHDLATAPSGPVFFMRWLNLPHSVTQPTIFFSYFVTNVLKLFVFF